MKTKNLNQSGFSLVELMITVAIIGILASISVPNYDRFAAKAKQSEAKAALSAIFTVEQTFFAEESTYTMCLYDAGYIPEGARRSYFTGFFNAGGNYIAPGGGPCNTAQVSWSGATRNAASFEMNVWANSSLRGAGAAGTYGMTGNYIFRGVAFGSISRANIFDIWTIDQNKRMVNEQPAF